MTDPLTLFERGVLDILKANNRLTDLVSVANWTTYADDSQPDPLDEQQQDSDLPELGIWQFSHEMNEGGRGQTSNSFMVTNVLSIGVNTGDLRTSVQLNPIVWEIIRAVVIRRHKAGTNFIPGLTFTRQLELGTFNHNVSNVNAENEARTTRGWSTVTQVKGVFVFDTVEVCA